MKINILAILIITITSCVTTTRKLPYYNTSNFTPLWQLPIDPKGFHAIRPFQLIDQNGNIFTEKNIENKICIADFFFTTCSGICLKMSNSMVRLQDSFINMDNILLLSHSVTPQQDSVPILAAYAIQKKVQYNKWKLLTGSKEEIYNLGRKFYFVEEDLGEKRNDSVFLHTENFILIDKNRRIRGIYNGLDANSINALVADVRELEKE